MWCDFFYPVVILLSWLLLIFLLCSQVVFRNWIIFALNVIYRNADCCCFIILAGYFLVKTYQTTFLVFHLELFLPYNKTSPRTYEIFFLTFKFVQDFLFNLLLFHKWTKRFRELTSIYQNKNYKRFGICQWIV